MKETNTCNANIVGISSNQETKQKQPHHKMLFLMNESMSICLLSNCIIFLPSLTLLLRSAVAGRRLTARRKCGLNNIIVSMENDINYSGASSYQTLIRTMLSLSKNLKCSRLFRFKTIFWFTNVE